MKLIYLLLKLLNRAEMVFCLLNILDTEFESDWLFFLVCASHGNALFICDLFRNDVLQSFEI